VYDPKPTNMDFKIQKTQRVNDPDGGWAMEKYNEVLENVEKMVNVGMADTDDEEWLPEDDSVVKKPIVKKGKAEYKYIVISSSSDMTETQKQLFDNYTKYIKSTYGVGVWKNRRDMIKEMVPEKDVQPTCGRITEMCKKFGKTCDDVKNERGLIFETGAVFRVRYE
jgi:hypothetical protein